MSERISKPPVRLKFLPGTHIDRAIEELIQGAHKHSEVSGTFNDLELRAGPETTAAELLQDFNAKQTARAEAWRQSEEGQRVAAERAKRVRQLQNRHDTLMRRFPSLDMQSDVAVLDWLCAYQETTDDVDIKTNPAAVVAAFLAAGYEPNANVGPAYQEAERANAFRYLVGQALDGLMRPPHCIHPILIMFADAWRKRFITKAQGG